MSLTEALLSSLCVFCRQSVFDRVLARGQFAGGGLRAATALFECGRHVGSPDVLNMGSTLTHFPSKYPIRTSGKTGLFGNGLGWLAELAAEGVETTARDLGIDQHERDKQGDTQAWQVTFYQQTTNR